MKVRNLGFLEFPNYEVDDLGNVYSLNYRNTGERRMLSPGVDDNGYLCVNLCNNGKQKTFKVHQLVLRAFNDWSMWGLEINHRDENKKNNNLTNLEWCDSRYNNNYGTRNERISKKVNQYTKDGSFIKTFNSLSEASTLTGVNIGNISSCLTGKLKSAGGYIWKYKDVSS